MGPVKEFTLHGLWPDECDGDFVKHCDPPREHDDVKGRLEQTDIFDDMKRYWPSFSPTPQHPDNNKFWSHEWNKHGTCVSTLRPRCGYHGDQDVHAYFNKTLALRKQYNIHKVLEKAAITPRPSFDRDPKEDDKYSVDAILGAIKDEWNVEAAVNCRGGNPLEVNDVFRLETIGYMVINQMTRLKCGKLYLTFTTG